MVKDRTLAAKYNVGLFERFKLSGVARGTIPLLVCSVAVKIIGALYKIPLYNALGSYGVGMYGLVFPVYAMLITLSGSGVPSALTKLISDGNDAGGVLLKSVKMFAVCGVVFTALLFCLSGFIATLQGNPETAEAYRMISPSVVLVSVIACLRGYFQGKSNFKPTAYSQLTEQGAKAIIGLSAVYLIQGSAVHKVALACLAVTLSEIIALIFMLATYFTHRRSESRFLDKGKAVSYKKILRYVIPLTAVSLMLPAASFADSFIAVNSLKTSFENPTQLYGLYGAADSIIALPSALTFALSSCFLPALSKGQVREERVLLTVCAVAFCCALGIFAFAPLITELLFSGMGGYQKLITRLLRSAAVCVVALPLLQCTNTILLSKGKQWVSVCTLAVGIAFKIMVDIWLIPMRQINIFGMIISDGGCYLVALALNLLYIISRRKSELLRQNN